MALDPEFVADCPYGPEAVPIDEIDPHQKDTRGRARVLGHPPGHRPAVFADGRPSRELLEFGRPRRESVTGEHSRVEADIDKTLDVRAPTQDQKTGVTPEQGRQ